MANVIYKHAERGRLVTFDVRNANDEFVHYIQTEIPALTTWAIGWCDDGLLTAIDLPLPGEKVEPTLARAQKHPPLLIRQPWWCTMTSTS